MQNKAVFPQAIKTIGGRCTAAITNPTNLTTIAGIVQLIAAGVDGTSVTQLTASVRETSTANVLALYRKIGSNHYLIKQKAVAAQTINATTGASTPVDFGYTEDSPLNLANGEQLWAGMMTANPATGYDFQGQARDW